MKIKTGYNIVMKTKSKKYIRKRKTMKKRIRKNKYFLKGGDAEVKEEETEKKVEAEVEKKEEGEKGEEKKAEGEKGEEKEAEGEKGEAEGKKGDVVVDSEGNKWTFKNDPALGPIYYSVWTLRGEPVYVWTADKFAFLTSGFKKTMLKWFLAVNPTAILMKTAMDTGLSLLEENKDKIQSIKQMFTMPAGMPAMPAMPRMPGSGMFGISKIPTAMPALPPIAGGGRKRKQRKFTKRRK